jgi:hypothetical protein
MEINVHKSRGKYDKRSHYRLEFIKEVQYKLLNHAFHSVFSQNLSEAGMCMLLDAEFLPGTLMEIKFNLPSTRSKPISTSAMVMWQKEYLTGVKFLNTPKGN